MNKWIVPLAMIGGFVILYILTRKPIEVITAENWLATNHPGWIILEVADEYVPEWGGWVKRISTGPTDPQEIAGAVLYIRGTEILDIYEWPPT